jgi:hypothetical protein
LPCAGGWSGEQLLLLLLMYLPSNRLDAWTSHVGLLDLATQPLLVTTSALWNPLLNCG